MIYKLIDLVREEKAINNTLGIRIKFKYNQFMNSITSWDQ